MKKIVPLSLIVFLFFISQATGQQNIKLPEIKAKAGMDVIQAMETRSATREFNKKDVPLEVISTILWAGNGIILEKGSKTIHGYDAVTSATNLNRYTTPWGWEEPYLKLYLILKNGVYEYSPLEHELKFLKDNSSSDDEDNTAMIVIAADFNNIHSANKEIRNVAFVSAGSAAQNMYVAGAVYNIQMFTKVFISEKWLTKSLNLPNKVEPLITLAFGYTK